MMDADPGMLMGDGSNAELVLASRSGVRAALLRGAGLEFVTIGSLVDEDELKNSFAGGGAPIGELAEALANLKAHRVSARRRGAFVIGADQILDLKGTWFDKPADRDDARVHLKALRGETHRLITAVCVARDSEILWRHIGEARLTMRRFDDAFLERYLDAMGDRVTDTVGGYQLEGLGAQLFSGIDGDFFTILGLPLLPLLGFLRERGLVPG